MTETIETVKPNMETQSALPPEETERLGSEIVAALKTVFDPEIPADLYELGLIYKVDMKDDRTVDVMMTLTTISPPSRSVSSGGNAEFVSILLVLTSRSLASRFLTSRFLASTVSVMRTIPAP